MTVQKENVSLFWFRRDLRLNDNKALYHALSAGFPVVPIFIFDKNILDQLPSRQDRRVQFIYEVLNEIQDVLKKQGSSLEVYYGTPHSVISALAEKYNLNGVYSNGDYEPYAIERDRAVNTLLVSRRIPFYSCKDHVIFEKKEVVKEDGSPYTVFTPYSKKWRSQLSGAELYTYDCKKGEGVFFRQAPVPFPALEEIGFETLATDFPSREPDQALLEHYGECRDYPALPGTSKLGVHLRFGTVSIRELVKKAELLSPVFLNELIWRDFYQMILWNFPHVGRGRAFKREYDLIEWRNDEAEFAAWCEGRTGYPIVDAGMRELNATGFMHNRVRMITASFLTKHLLTDWRWGEAYFAEKLLDYDFAANNGGWQWAAGSGCDAAPYFRIFNPALQTQKFDKQQNYIRYWVPELDSPEYPPPVVEHGFARNRCLEAYKKALKREC